MLSNRVGNLEIFVIIGKSQVFNCVKILKYRYWVSSFFYVGIWFVSTIKG